jgi:O-antigen/teichoic acid export membrane protein
MNRQAALIAYRAASDVVAKGAFFLITIAAARRLAPDGYGIFALTSTVGWIAAIASDFGIQMHLAREVAIRPRDADGLLRKWLALRVATSAAALGLIAAGLSILLAALPAARPYALAALLMAATYLTSGLVEFLHYFYRGLARTDLESTLTLVQRIATLGLALLVLWLRPDVTLLAAAMLAPVVLTFACSVRLAARLARPGRDAAAASIAPSRPAGGLLAELKRDVIPIGAGLVMSALYFRIDVFLVEFWNGTHEVALYNAVFRLVEALRLFPAAVLAVTLPTLCRATTLRPLVQVSSIVTAFAVLAGIAMWASAGWLIPLLYGPPYAGAVPAFRILLVAFPLMSLNYALTHQLIGWSGHRAYAAVCAAAFVFNVALNARLIPLLSIDGAAWTTVWTEVVLAVGCVGALWLLSARADAEPSVVMGAS